MSDPLKTPNILRISALSQHHATPISVLLDVETCKEISNDLDLTSLRKVNFTGTIEATGKADWSLVAQLGATVVQPCVVTLAPVKTRIETSIERRYLAQMPTVETDAELGEEIEMPDDESIEPLGAMIDLQALLTEALALALPLYPRSANADLGTAIFTEPGKKPMQDQDALPFASLAGLRDQLTKKDNKED